MYRSEEPSYSGIRARVAVAHRARRRLSPSHPSHPARALGGLHTFWALRARERHLAAGVEVDPLPWTVIGLIFKPFRVLPRHAGVRLRQHQTGLRCSFQSSGVRGTQAAVTAPWVVPALNPGEDRHAGLGLALENVALDEFTFQAGEEALDHRVL